MEALALAEEHAGRTELARSRRSTWPPDHGEGEGRTASRRYGYYLIVEGATRDDLARKAELVAEAFDALPVTGREAVEVEAEAWRGVTLRAARALWVRDVSHPAGRRWRWTTPAPPCATRERSGGREHDRARHAGEARGRPRPLDGPEAQARRLVTGAKRVLDAIATDSTEETADGYRVGPRHTRSLVLDGLPATALPGWDSGWPACSAWTAGRRCGARCDQR